MVTITSGTLPKPRRGEIALKKSGSSYQSASAWIYGPLAVHKAKARRGGSWRVTHVQSGLALTSTIADFATKREAVACVGRLLALPINWDVGENELREQIRNRNIFDLVKNAFDAPPLTAVT